MLQREMGRWRVQGGDYKRKKSDDRPKESNMDYG